MRDNEGSSKRVRVTIQDSDGEGVTMKIEGRIAGFQVPELHRAWENLALSLGRRKLLVDLRGVTHVDGTGRNLLAKIHGTAGAEFLADTPLTKYFAEVAQQGIRTKSDQDSNLRRQS
jgi:anti-anti-sigma regulatory factor